MGRVVTYGEIGKIPGDNRNENFKLTLEFITGNWF